MPIVFDAPKIREMIHHETPATLAAKKMSLIQSGPLIGLKVEHLPLPEDPDAGASAGEPSSPMGRYSALARENLETMERAVHLIEGRDNPAQRIHPSRKRKSDDSQTETAPEKKTKHEAAELPSAEKTESLREKWGGYRSFPAPGEELDSSESDSSESDSEEVDSEGNVPLRAPSPRQADWDPDVAEALNQLDDAVFHYSASSGEETPPTPPSPVAPAPSPEDAMDVDEAT